MQINIRELNYQTSERAMDHEFRHLVDAILPQMFVMKNFRNWQREMKLYLNHLKLNELNKEKPINHVRNINA